MRKLVDPGRRDKAEAFVTAGDPTGGGPTGHPPPCQPTRSGSALGASGRGNTKRATGRHFGHHKNASPRPGSKEFNNPPATPSAAPPMGSKPKAKAAKPRKKRFNNPEPESAKPTAQQRPSIMHFDSPPSQQEQAMGMNAPTPTSVIPFFPSLDNFVPSSMDTYNYGAGAFPPPAGNKRNTAVGILICGTSLEGLRNRGSVNEGYTHVLLADPNAEVHDMYRSDGGAGNSGEDFLAIPSGQTNNYWQVVFTAIVSFPGLGRRKVIYADRRGTPGSWPTIL